MKRPLVSNLIDYPWSSYPAFVNKVKLPDWLHTEQTYQMLGSPQGYKAYTNFVNQGVDDETSSFYNRGNHPSVIGNADFKAKISDELLYALSAENKIRVVQPNIPMEKVTAAVAKHYNTTNKLLRTVVKGPTKGNEARKVSMYLCQELSGVILNDIAVYFGLNHIGSVSFITHQIRKSKQNDEQLDHEISAIIDLIMKQAI